MADPASRADARDVVAAASPTAAATLAVSTRNCESSLLACDFTSPDRPALVTALLSAFLIESDSGHEVELIELWNLPVSTRHLWLIRIATALDATPALDLQLRCSQENCREWLEVSLPVAELGKLHDKQATRETLVLASSEEPVALRRPTGEDLKRWHSTKTDAQGSDWQQMMLRDLVVSGQAPKDFPPLDDALENFDPLLAFTLTAVCPACQGGTNHLIDLETIAISRLRVRQSRLLQEIHQLALAYGWTETEALNVPPARRNRYLEMIETIRTS